MKNALFILATAILILTVEGCTQAVVKDTIEKDSFSPIDLGLNKSKILVSQYLNSEIQEELIHNSSCQNKYVLQMRRISPISKSLVLRVVTNVANNAKSSLVVNTIELDSLSSAEFNTVLLYDGKYLICFKSNDECGFIQPYNYSQDIEFEVRWLNVLDGLTTTPQTISWKLADRNCFTIYPKDPNDIENPDPYINCPNKLIHIVVGSPTTLNSMRYSNPWDKEGFK